MSALAEALAAAQTRAVSALGKQYVGGQLDRDAVIAGLEAVGLTDATDRDRWLAALGIIRSTGAEVPAEPKPQGAKTEPASDAQWSLIRKLADEKGTTAPVEPLTKAQAHIVIDQLKAGTFKADEWEIPF